MRRWHEEAPLMQRRKKRAKWSWSEQPVGWFRKNNPFRDHGCRCSWCRPEKRSRKTEKTRAIQDQAY